MADREIDQYDGEQQELIHTKSFFDQQVWNRSEGLICYIVLDTG
jgi:hypothetical protein